MIGLAIATAGCVADRSVGLVDAPATIEASWVAGEAAAALTPSGTFALATPPEGTEVIGEAAARSQAAAWLATFAQYQVGRLSREAATEINIAELSLCPRAYYGHSAYEAVPSDAPPAIRRTAGPHWLMSFCDPSGRALIALAVSGLNSDVEVVNGKLRLPRLQGEQFHSRGIPAGVEGLPIGPEQAAGIAFRALRVRISMVPELHLPPRPIPPHLARWRIALEHPVRVKDNLNRSDETREVWVGSRDGRGTVEIAVNGAPLSPLTLSTTMPGPDWKTVSPVQTFTAAVRPARTAWIPIRGGGSLLP